MRPILAVIAILAVESVPASALEPIPDKLVVLTFDDSSKSHYTVARPLLKKHGFGATFFITEGFDFSTNKKDYMSWDEIAQLHRDGFEIGNHTRDHMAVTPDKVRDLAAQVRAINQRCKDHGIPETTSFAYPGNALSKEALPVLKDLGIRFARRGGSPEYPYKEGRGFAYEPGLDHALLVPSAGDARPAWKLEDFVRAVSLARHGRIAVLQFHGVPDTAHEWVNSTREQFESYLKYLTDNGFTVIAMRDLAKYVDPTVVPTDPWGVIEDRKKLLADNRDGLNARPAPTDADLKHWLANMATHRFTPAEMGAALGKSEADVRAATQRLKIEPIKAKGKAPLVLPFPGGRHPRVGFLDGAIRPQRETKVSMFAPWADSGYAVADVPEAIWFEPGGKRELLYLAHTHIPTYWDKRKETLEPREWQAQADGSWRMERTLPNKVTFGTTVVPEADGVAMQMWIRNESADTLTGLNVQNCVMLKGLAGFEGRTNDNKVFASPFAACRDASGKRWVISGWQECARAWGNPPCPCLHADPKFPDCRPGETKTIRGWLSFYEGEDIRGELRRLQARVAVTAAPMERIVVSRDRKGFERQGQAFVPWGFNYDHDTKGRLLEDYWVEEWEAVRGDFAEMKALGANVVRIHLQFGKFMDAADRPNAKALARLGEILKLAASNGLYLDITGLGCYHKADVPAWYDKLDEAGRWAAQGVFWEAVATQCKDSPAVFCYDLMNEPVVPGGKRPAGDWLGPAFGNKHFVQFVTLDQGGRKRPAIAAQWVKQLSAAIRKHDRSHLITVGLVDWSLDRPGLTSGFVPREIARDLDFIAVHLYPKTGRVDEAIETLKGFDVGKPIVIEETFPLGCTRKDFEAFLARSKPQAAGWIGFYWGTPPTELNKAKSIGDALLWEWLDVFQKRGTEMTKRP